MPAKLSFLLIDGWMHCQDHEKEITTAVNKLLANVESGELRGEGQYVQLNGSELNCVCDPNVCCDTGDPITGDAVEVSSERVYSRHK